MARSHCPRMHVSWKSKVRSLGSAGALRMAACRPARASSSLPCRTSSSNVLMGAACEVRVDRKPWAPPRKRPLRMAEKYLELLRDLERARGDRGVGRVVFLLARVLEVHGSEVE